MMVIRKFYSLIAVPVMVGTLVGTGICAEKMVADSFVIESPEYTKRTRNNIEFTHEKHITEYNIACGECHHDENNEPLKNLKLGDDVQRCIECHKKLGRKRAPKGEKWSKTQLMEYHANAVHENCITCHREHNKKNKTKAAPTNCKACHPDN